MAPLARGTEFADMLRVKELVVAGANAAAELMMVAKIDEVFMVVVNKIVILDYSESSFLNFTQREEVIILSTGLHA